MESSTDSEFFPEEESTSEDETNTIATNTTATTSDEEYILDLSDDDLITLMELAMELIDDYYNQHVLSISSAKYREEIIGYTTEIIFTDVQSMSNDHLYDEHADQVYNEIQEMVEGVFNNYMDMQIRRQRSMSVVDTDSETTINDDKRIAIDERIRTLNNTPQPVQKTPEWYEFRYNLITASNLWKVFGSYAQVNSLIYEKCKPLDMTNSFGGYQNTGSTLHWGVKYEPLTIMIYEAIYRTRVGAFGCIQHPKYSFVGASPDGINIDPTNSRYGRMLEIKNIVNRDITGTPKEEYWIQTQIQMETCDLDDCDFVETRFKEYESEDAFYADTTRKYRGVILNFISQQADAGFAPVYKYMPLSIPNNKQSVSKWISDTRDETKKDGLALFSVIYWYLDQISCILIPRNREWFRAACAKIADVWNIILHERKHGYEHRASKKRVPKVAAAPALEVVKLNAETTA
jgi:putative phage-type endonuclease